MGIFIIFNLLSVVMDKLAKKLIPAPKISKIKIATFTFRYLKSMGRKIAKRTPYPPNNKGISYKMPDWSLDKTNHLRKPFIILFFVTGPIAMPNLSSQADIWIGFFPFGKRSLATSYYRTFGSYSSIC